MNAMKHAQHFILKNSDHGDARTLAQLVLSLESGDAFPLELLYELDMERFNLALEILKEWRLDRYYAGKSKLFDIAVQLQSLTQAVDSRPMVDGAV